LPGLPDLTSSEKPLIAPKPPGTEANFLNRRIVGVAPPPLPQTCSVFRSIRALIGHLCKRPNERRHFIDQKTRHHNADEQKLSSYLSFVHYKILRVDPYPASCSAFITKYCFITRCSAARAAFVAQLAEVNDPSELRTKCEANVKQVADSYLRCTLPDVWVRGPQPPTKKAGR